MITSENNTIAQQVSEIRTHLGSTMLSVTTLKPKKSTNELSKSGIEQEQGSPIIRKRRVMGLSSSTIGLLALLTLMV